MISNTAKTKKNASDFPKEYFYGENSLEAVKVSPNGDYVTFRLTEESKEKNENRHLILKLN